MLATLFSRFLINLYNRLWYLYNSKWCNYVLSSTQSTPIRLKGEVPSACMTSLKNWDKALLFYYFRHLISRNFTFQGSLPETYISRTKFFPKIDVQPARRHRNAQKCCSLHFLRLYTIWSLHSSSNKTKRTGSFTRIPYLS